MIIDLIAKEEIHKGDFIVKLWKKYARRAKLVDSFVKVKGLSLNNIKKGQKCNFIDIKKIGKYEK
jgi:hypothetical protein